MGNNVRRVRQVLVTVFFPRHVGGLQTHFDLLLQGLSKEKIRVVHLQMDRTELSFWRKAWYGFRHGLNRDRVIARLKAQQMITFHKLLYQIVKTSAVELLHCHDAFSAYCAQDIRLPLVLTVHGPLHLEYAMLGGKDIGVLRWFRQIEEVAYSRADAIIAVDSGLKNYITNEFHIDSDKVEVIANAVDVDEVVRLSQKACSISTNIDAPYVLVPRRLVPKNGVSVAVQAMNLLKNEPFKLVIAGDGPERGRITRLIKDYCLQEKVILLGEVRREDVLSLMRTSFVVAIPSVPSKGVVEATSLSALEAMALGKVVVASDIGGLREIINNGVDGLLFEPGNEKLLSEVLLLVFKDEALRSRVGINARRKVLESYSMPVWISKVLHVYEDAFKWFHER